MNKETKAAKKARKEENYTYEPQPVTYYSAIGGQVISSTRIEHRRVRIN